MKILIKALFLISILFLANAAKGDYRLIVNKGAGITSLTKSELKSIFLGRKTLWDSGTVVLPCYSDFESDGTHQFFNNIVKKNADQYRRYWNKRLFSGRGMPPMTFKSNDQVVAHVKQNKGAICFCSDLSVMLPNNVITILLNE
jgi:ABC-type phosphate transport system substrate-binding protein